MHGRVKPAEQTPLSALRLGQLFSEAGFPDGVATLFRATVKQPVLLAAHPDRQGRVHGINRSRQTDRSRGTETLKGIARIGRKSPNVVFEDADLDTAIRVPRVRFSLTTGNVAVLVPAIR
jgi:acyl-CoA reductase-like NAD-dependent aldehyde dehydrogenase